MSISTSPWQSFATNLMQDFKTQYAGQSGLLNYLTGIFQPMVQAGGIGFNADTLAAMRTGAADTTSQQFQNAKQSLQQNQALTQEAGLPSGVAAQANEELAAAAAGQNATAQNNITLANEEQRQNNLKFATSGLNTIAEEENPLGFASAADQAGQTAADIENANTQQKANSFMGKFTSGLGSTLGAAAGGFLTGGAGAVLSGTSALKGAASGMTSALYG